MIFDFDGKFSNRKYSKYIQVRFNPTKPDKITILIIKRSIYDYRTCSTGSPPLTGSGIVRIVVLDVNDHIPEFTRQEYRATVTENSVSRTWVTKPHATDKDEGLNAKIR